MSNSKAPNRKNARTMFVSFIYSYLNMIRIYSTNRSGRFQNSFFLCSEKWKRILKKIIVTYISRFIDSIIKSLKKLIQVIELVNVIHMIRLLRTVMNEVSWLMPSSAQAITPIPELSLLWLLHSKLPAWFTTGRYTAMILEY